MDSTTVLVNEWGHVKMSKIDSICESYSEEGKWGSKIINTKSDLGTESVREKIIRKQNSSIKRRPDNCALICRSIYF